MFYKTSFFWCHGDDYEIWLSGNAALQILIVNCIKSLKKLLFDVFTVTCDVHK